MISIDQNSHSLWDVLPKLQALVRAGRKVRHFVEDVDVAFTALGSGLGGSMRLARERFHRSGGQDWGAALFYSEFLGRLPVEIRDWEPYTGMTTKALAGQLGRTIDDLYAEFSPADNWQLIGPSFVGDREHHRVIGDLTVAETADFLREILDLAVRNVRQVFVEKPARRRGEDWLAGERHRLDGLIEDCSGGKLTDLYQAWLRQYLGGDADVDAASRLLDASQGGRLELLRLFTLNYELAGRLYNEAVAESAAGLHPLDLEAGELPFFATMEYEGHLVRTVVQLCGGELVVNGSVVPLHDGLPKAEGLGRAGVRCLAGKALALVLQVRMPPNGSALALPYRGSLYMPAAHLLQAKLRGAGLLPDGLRPLVRVRLHLLDRMEELETILRLPPHLRSCFGREELPARELAGNWREVSREARRRLGSFREEPGRRTWQRQALPELSRELADLDGRRRELAKTAPKSSEIRELSRQAKALEVELLDHTLRRIACDWQLRDLDYWDSRGAILPWAVALGGQEFYNSLLRRAEIYEETPEHRR